MSDIPVSPTPVTPIAVAVLAAEISGATEAGAASGRPAQVTEVIERLLAVREPRIVTSQCSVVLAAFDSAVDAVNAAVEARNAVARCNEAASAETRVAIRVGIYLGKVAIIDDGIFGDTCSLAFRVAMQAPPGGIYVTEEGWRQSREKVALEVEAVGEPAKLSATHVSRLFAVKLD